MDRRRTRSGQAPVVVGVDGSPASESAACLGAWEATRRRSSLLLVHAFSPPIPLPSHGWASSQPQLLAARHAARSMLTGTEMRVHTAHPRLTVRSAIVGGSPGGALVELSHSAELVIVGARGSGGFAALPFGSVAAQVVRHAHTPVIVTRPPKVGTEPEGRCAPRPARGSVVAGIDGYPADAEALAFAFEEATARGAPLVAVYAWWLLPPGNLGPATVLHYDPAQAQDEAQRMLAETLAGWAEKYPEVEVRARAVHDMNPTLALIDASRDAALLVVGARGRGGFEGLLLGSVSQALAAHAPCPVAVVRGPAPL